MSLTAHNPDTIAVYLLTPRRKPSPSEYDRRVSSSKPSAVPILGDGSFAKSDSFYAVQGAVLVKNSPTRSTAIRGIPGPMATGTPFTTGYIHAHSEHVQPSNVWSTVQFMRLPSLIFLGQRIIGRLPIFCHFFDQLKGSERAGYSVYFVMVIVVTRQVLQPPCDGSTRIDDPP